MNRIKRKFPYILGIIICSLGLLGMLFAYFVQSGINYSYGVTGYNILNVSGLGFWLVLLSILHVLLIVFFCITICLCFLEILDDTKIINFKITFRKVTSFIVLKVLLFTLLILSILEIFVTWFLILANSELGFVFGAGTFVMAGVMGLGYLLFLFLQRADYFKNWNSIDAREE